MKNMRFGVWLRPTMMKLETTWAGKMKKSKNKKRDEGVWDEIGSQTDVIMFSCDGGHVFESGCEDDMNCECTDDVLYRKTTE